MAVLVGVALKWNNPYDKTIWLGLTLAVLGSLGAVVLAPWIEGA